MVANVKSAGKPAMYVHLWHDGKCSVCGVKIFDGNDLKVICEICGFASGTGVFKDAPILEIGKKAISTSDFTKDDMELIMLCMKVFVEAELHGLISKNNPQHIQMIQNDLNHISVLAPKMTEFNKNKGYDWSDGKTNSHLFLKNGTKSNDVNKGDTIVATEKLPDQAKTTVVKEEETVSQPTKIEETAKQTMQFDENALFQIARNSQNEQERRTAIIALKNQSLLHEIVINASAESKNIGLDTLAALKKVNDFGMLKTIAKEAKDWDIRARTCMWLEDIEFLTEISKNDSNDLVQEASNSKIRILSERKTIDTVPSFESLFFQIGLFARGETADSMCPYSYKSMSIRDQFVAYGKTAAQAIKSYLMTCAAGREQYGWWQNSSLLVECITLSAGSSEADKLMLEAWLVQLVNVKSNISEYDRNVRIYAQIELDAISCHENSATHHFVEKGCINNIIQKP